MPTFRRPELLQLAGLLGAALLVRSVAWAQTTVLFDDGPLFLYMAEAIADGDWSAVLRHPYHPLYPILIWMFGPLTGGDLEQAGALVSIVAGSGAVGALWFFLREAFDSSVAFVGGLILALHPFAVEFASDVQSEGLYLALLLAGICVLWHALQTSRLAHAAAAGLLSGLAYLVRPEGLSVLLIGSAASGVMLLSRSWRPARAAGWAAALLTGGALMVAPYVTAMHAETGVWSLTQKKSISALFSLSADKSAAEVVREAPAASAEALPVQKSLTLAGRMTEWRQLSISERLMPAYSELWKAVVSGIRVELMVMIAIGIFLVRGRPGGRALFVLSFVALYAGVLFALAMNAGYVSRRHALPPLVPLLGYAGVGAIAIGEHLLKLWARIRPRSDPRGVTAAIVTASLLIACMWLPRDLRSRRDERLAERLAAEWLKQTDPAAEAVGAGRLRVAYYAGADFVPLPPEGSPAASDPLIDYLQQLGARYLIVDEALAAEHSGLREAQAGGLRLMHRAQARGYSAAVFAVPSGAPPTL